MDIYFSYLVTWSIYSGAATVLEGHNYFKSSSQCVQIGSIKPGWHSTEFPHLGASLDGLIPVHASGMVLYLFMLQGKSGGGQPHNSDLPLALCLVEMCAYIKQLYWSAGPASYQYVTGSIAASDYLLDTFLVFGMIMYLERDPAYFDTITWSLLLYKFSTCVPVLRASAAAS